MSNSNAIIGLANRVRSWFPDREFFMRSEGQVRFITISSKVQMTAAALALAALVVCAASVAIAGWTQYRAETERLSLRDREARVATAEERVDAYGADIAAVKDDLNRRMEFLEAMGEALPEDLKAFSSVSDSASEAAETVEKVSAAFPEAAELARIEARQLALVEGLTHYADWRAQRAAAALEKLGLDSASMIRTAERGAMGGPFENLATEADGSIDPRFVRLGLSIARMDALERGLAGVPQVTPAHKDMISSGFGFRRETLCLAVPGRLRRLGRPRQLRRLEGRLWQDGRDHAWQRPDDALCAYVALQRESRPARRRGRDDRGHRQYRPFDRPACAF